MSVNRAKNTRLNKLKVLNNMHHDSVTWLVNACTRGHGIGHTANCNLLLNEFHRCPTPFGHRVIVCVTHTITHVNTELSGL